MKIDEKTVEQLLAENEELRFRLEDTEEVLRAIQSGEVDALVVSRPEGEQIYTLQGAEHPYRILVETMSEGAATLDLDGTIIYCNRRLAAMLQVPLEKLIGSRLQDYVALADYPIFDDRIKNCAEACDKLEISLISGQGRQLPANFSCCPVEFSGGRGFSVVLSDISSEKEAENKILRLNRLYAVLSGTDNAIVHATDRDSMFLEICRVAIQNGGFKMAWIGLINEETRAIKAVAWSGAIEGFMNGDIFVMEGAECRGATGTTVREGGLSIASDIMNDARYTFCRNEAEKLGYRSSAAISLKQSGRIVGVLTLYSGEKDFFNSEFSDLLLQMGMDISFALDNFEHDARRREAEQALRDQIMERLQVTEALHEKERLLILQSRQAAMGEMVNNIAHQWRQPLNALGLTIQQMLLYYDLGELNRDFLDSSVDKSMELVQHMSQTIDDFRNFFRPDREVIQFNLNERIRNTLALTAESLETKKITVELQMEEDAVVNGYPNEYSQVVLNILNNASDVFEERKISSPCLCIRVFKEGDRSVTTISDNAGGISESIIHKIFDPYFTTKNTEKGTGIGLYMSKAIIEERMNGRLLVRNTNNGAEFRIEV